MSDAPLDTVAFAERLLALLDEGSFTSTYKFAVLLGLIDLCLEGTARNGAAPEHVTTVQLAHKIVELYWRQVSRYDEAGTILAQNALPSIARILRLIAEFRRRHGEGLTLYEAKRRDPSDFDNLLREIEWTLVLMPLPKLQRFGNSDEHFIYSIDWDDAIQQSEWSNPQRFDNRIRFIGDAASHLVRLSTLLRPLIQQQWAEKVSALNQLKIDRLEEFLFGCDRAALVCMARPLLEVQTGRCFYCGDALQAPIHVDHFVPWSRHPDDGIDNLVAAHQRCNLAKRNFLAGNAHLLRWMKRGSEDTVRLGEIAGRQSWPRDHDRTLGTVRAAYLTVSRGQRLWLGGKEFEAADRAELARALAV